MQQAADDTAPRQRGARDAAVACFFVVTGLLGSLGGATSPQILGNGTDPAPSFRQGAILATIAILAFVTVWPRLTRGARVVVAVLLLFDLWIVVECAAHVGARFVQR